MLPQDCRVCSRRQDRRRRRRVSQGLRDLPVAGSFALLLLLPRSLRPSIPRSFLPWIPRSLSVGGLG